MKVYSDQVGQVRLSLLGFNPFLASDWLFSYARKFSSTRVDSELRASIDKELRAPVTVSLLLIGSFLTRLAFYLVRATRVDSNRRAYSYACFFTLIPRHSYASRARGVGT